MSLCTVSDEFLAGRVRAGDQAAFAELAQRYAPLLMKATMRAPRGVEPEDLRQDALLGLLRACKAHGPGAAPFAGYAKRGVRWRVARAIETALRHKRRVLSDAVRDGAEPSQQVIARLPASVSSDPAWLAEVRDELRVRAEQERACRERRRVHSRVYSPEQKEQALAMIAGGRRIKEVTFAIGAQKTTVRRWVERGGVSRPDGRRRYTPEEIERALTLIEQGATYHRAGAAVGASAAAVSHWARRTGRRGGSRRRQFTPDEVRHALALVESGASLTHAAAAIGTCEDTIRRWKREAA
jgi:RNA polymerase sigma factor (sigma-70 family)